MNIKEKEINCINCRYFNGINKECSIKNASPIRKCVIAINKNLIKEISIKSEKIELLEIGCGNCSYMKEENNLKWDGIDIEKIDYKGRETIATKIGSVEDIPFEKEKFDYVLANQSIEHWFEYGVTLKRALSQISRVLKNNGKIVINAPVHFHGHKFFLEGDLKNIYKLFNQKYWNDVVIEKWRINPFPLSVYQGWKRNVFSDCLGSKYDNKISYTLNVRATKKKEVKNSFFDNLKYYLYKIIFNLMPHKKILIFLNYGFVYSFRILKNRKKYKEYEEKLKSF